MEHASFVEKRCSRGNHIIMSLDKEERRELSLMSDKDQRSSLVDMYYTLDVSAAGWRDSKYVLLVEALCLVHLEHKQTRHRITRILDSLGKDPRVVRVE